MDKPHPNKSVLFDIHKMLTLIDLSLLGDFFRTKSHIEKEEQQLDKPTNRAS